MAEREIITAEYVRQLFDYDSAAGVLTWKKSRRRRHGLPVAGGRPRAQVRINGRSYLVHRLIWLYHYGEFPKAGVDHINMDPSDNRIENLREADKSQNGFNRRAQRDNRLGVKGVTFYAHCNRYHARTTVRGRKINLGYYKTVDEAKAAYVEAVHKYHGEFARPE
jgi:hypothetical protein